MRVLVQKFGGTSLADLERLRHVASLIKAARAEGYSVVVVVSAMGSYTDQLISQAEPLSSALTSREMACYLVTGEMQSAALLAMALAQCDIAAYSCSAAQIDLRASGRYDHAQLVSVDTNRIQAILNKGIVPVICGFQALNQEDEWVTLGRSGSDTTAVFIASKLYAERCDIYKDVCGVMSADPKKIEGVKQIYQMPLLAMLEFAKRGAEVLHLNSIEKAIESRVNLTVKSSFENAVGTVFTTGVPQDICYYGVVHEQGFSQLITDEKYEKMAGIHIHQDLNGIYHYTGKHADILWLSDMYLKTHIASISQLDKITIVGTNLSRATEALSWINKSPLKIHGVQINDFSLSFYVDHTQGERMFKEVHTCVIDGFFVRDYSTVL